MSGVQSGGFSKRGDFYRGTASPGGDALNQLPRFQVWSEKLAERIEILNRTSPGWQTSLGLSLRIRAEGSSSAVVTNVSLLLMELQIHRCLYCKQSYCWSRVVIAYCMFYISGWGVFSVTAQPYINNMKMYCLDMERPIIYFNILILEKVL